MNLTSKQWGRAVGGTTRRRVRVDDRWGTHQCRSVSVWWIRSRRRSPGDASSSQRSPGRDTSPFPSRRPSCPLAVCICAAGRQQARLRLGALARVFTYQQHWWCTAADALLLRPRLTFDCSGCSTAAAAWLDDGARALLWSDGCCTTTTRGGAKEE